MKRKAEIIQAVSAHLTAKLLDLEGIYLFGSRGTDEANEASDWDFAYLSREGLTNEAVWDLRSGLASEFDTSFDLVDLYKSNTVLQVQVLKTGKLVWIGNDAAVKQFEYLTLSYYQKLNDERADILKDIQSRGSIYG